MKIAKLLRGHSQTTFNRKIEKNEGKKENLKKKPKKHIGYAGARTHKFLW